MLFSKKKHHHPLVVDIHSHLIPGIDDGAQSINQSIEMIEQLVALGFQKVITTPHIHPRYPNTPTQIMSGLRTVQNAIIDRSIPVEIEAGAEYFVDESFHKQVVEKEPLLSFGDRFVLVESAFVNKPIFFENVLFDLKSQGYKPILAHPERYQFLEGSLSWLQELKEMGILFQVTLGSLAGYYGDQPQRVSKQLMKKRMVDFLGSDLHKASHIRYLENALRAKETQQLIEKGHLMNMELL